jgi:hypothetical protein
MSKLNVNDIEKRPGANTKLSKVYGVSWSPKKEGEPFVHWAVQVGEEWFYHLKFIYTKADGTIVKNPLGVRFVPENRRNLEGRLYSE